jgi:proline iminopeptidase
MQGPNEFLYTGNLKDWNRIPDMPKIRVPVLITVGKYDELGPACALRMKHALPAAQLVVFPNSSHTPFYEEPEAYYAVLLDFLARHRSGVGPTRKLRRSRCTATASSSTAPCSCCRCCSGSASSRSS